MPMPRLNLKAKIVGNPMDCSLGYRLRNLRENKMLEAFPGFYPTTAEVSQETDISVGTINALENDNNSNPSAEVLKRLAWYYGVTTDYILGLSPNRHPDTARTRRALDAESATALQHLKQQGQQATLEYALVLLQSLNLSKGGDVNGNN